MRSRRALVGATIVLLPVLLLLPVRESAGESGMSHRSEARRVMLNVSSGNDGYLKEVHSLSFESGMNRIRLRFETARYDRESFLFVPGSSDVRVKRTSFLDDRTVLVVTESDVDSIVPVTFFARIRGLTNRSFYRANLTDNRKRIHLLEELTLFNRSGQSFSDAWLGVGFGSWLRTSLGDGEEKRIRIYEKDAIPTSVRYRVDNAKDNLDDEFTALPVYYVFRNTPESNLGDRALRSGKIRFFRGRGGTSEVFLGEARVSRTPVGDSVSVSAGTSREVRAKRSVVDRERRNVRRNQRRRIQLYDEVITYEYTVENNSDRPASVRISEPMDGEWTLQNASHDYEVLSNSAFRVSPTLPPNTSETIRVTVKTVNNMPQQR